MGDIPTNSYTKQTKKTFLFTMMFETIILLICFAYFLCVVTAYYSAMHGPEKEPEPEGEKKPDEPAPAPEEEKKDDEEAPKAEGE